MADDKAAREREMNRAAMARASSIPAVSQISPEIMGALRALTPAQAAGLAAGTHVVVPVRPDGAMLKAAAEAEHSGPWRNYEIYRAMLAAAQKEG